MDIGGLVGAVGAPVASVLTAAMTALRSGRLEARINRHLAILERLRQQGEPHEELARLVRSEIGELAAREGALLGRKLNWATLAYAVVGAVGTGVIGAQLMAASNLFVQSLGVGVTAFGTVMIVGNVLRHLWRQEPVFAPGPKSHRESESVAS